MLMLHTNELNYISFILMRKLLILIVVFFSYFNTVLAEVSYQEILKDPENLELNLQYVAREQEANWQLQTSYCNARKIIRYLF